MAGFISGSCRCQRKRCDRATLITLSVFNGKRRNVQPGTEIRKERIGECGFQLHRGDSPILASLPINPRKSRYSNAWPEHSSGQASLIFSRQQHLCVPGAAAVGHVTIHARHVRVNQFSQPGKNQTGRYGQEGADTYTGGCMRAADSRDHPATTRQYSFLDASKLQWAAAGCV